VKILVLNASYEPIRIISWQRAICYIVLEKADVISSYDEVVRSEHLTINLPKVIKLRKYVHLADHITAIRYSKKNILTRDKMECQYCGEKCTGANATVDHIIPKSRGGATSWTNIVTACYSCNNKKDNMTPCEAGMVLLSKPVEPQIGYMLKHKLFEEFELEQFQTYSSY
jgi:5-methylcytosine-specific restriction endonuclease McrA